MHILGAGRAAFLEFLRNLTPCFLVASVALLLWARLDFARIDLSNWAATGAFYVCAMIALLSFWANMWQFLDSAMGPSNRLDRGIRRLRLRGVQPRKLFFALLMLKWRKNPWYFFQAVIAMLVVYAAMMVGVVTSISAATTALRNGLR